MAPKIFIDGESGTTGLQIRERLAGRKDIELVSIDPALRKDSKARADMFNGADVVILCLPDEAAKEAVSLIENNATRVIDASTAHRVAPGWTYGFAELDDTQRDQIAETSRLANPGCFATGAIALLRPLVSEALVPHDFPVTVNAVTGYSGGGKGLIAEYEASDSTDEFRPYGLNLHHKHLPEMQAYSFLKHPPLFAPAVGRFAQGMAVEVPLQLWALPDKPTPSQLRRVMAEHYAGEPFVTVAGDEETAELVRSKTVAAGYAPTLDPESLNGTNSLKLFVFGEEHGEQALLIAILDNLGKGASGAAVQNLNLMLGLDEEAGLTRA